MTLARNARRFVRIPMVPVPAVSLRAGHYKVAACGPGNAIDGPKLLTRVCANVRTGPQVVRIMSYNSALSRRSFLQSAGTAGVAAWLRVGAPAAAGIAQAACAARAQAADYVFLSAEDAADFEAMAARIIPTTATPGAREAGVIHFFDQAFADAMQDSAAFALAELESLNGELGSRFAAHDAARQDEILRGIEDGPLFGLVRVMTIFGFFAMEKYGGNRGHVGWDVIGFQGHKGANTYPFGHYDAAVHREPTDAE